MRGIDRGKNHNPTRKSLSRRKFFEDRLTPTGDQRRIFEISVRERRGMEDNDSIDHAI